MLTGIMLLFEVGLALNGQSLFSESNRVENFQDGVNQSERLFLAMLTDPQDLTAIKNGRPGDLCTQILCRIKGVGCSSGNSINSLLRNSSLQLYTTARMTPSLISSSCALERPLDFPDPSLAAPFGC